MKLKQPICKKQEKIGRVAAGKTKKATPKQRYLTGKELESMRKPLEKTIKAFTKIIDKGVAFPGKEKEIKKVITKLLEIKKQFYWTVWIQS